MNALAATEKAALGVVVSFMGAVTHAGTALGLTLADMASEVWPDDEMPMNPSDIKASKVAQRIRTVADRVAGVALPSELVRGVDQSQPAIRKVCAAPSDVSAFLSQLAGVVTTEAPTNTRTHCHRCNRELTAATVHILDGHPYGPECIRKVDAFGDAEIVTLAQWMATDDDVTQVTRTATHAVIFCSATLAAPDMTHFLRQVGIEDALQMQAGSPFDYESNALLYIPNGTAPTPNSAEWLIWMVGEVRRLVYASIGGAFLLFTSNRALRHAAEALRGEFTRNYLRVFVQGELPKMEIAKQFRQCSNGVLFATKSFY
jgi:Rad3-related DNA helicase